jgi:hypothetical protein
MASTHPNAPPAIIFDTFVPFEKAHFLAIIELHADRISEDAKL